MERTRWYFPTMISFWVLALVLSFIHGLVTHQASDWIWAFGSASMIMVMVDRSRLCRDIEAERDIAASDDC